MLNHEPMNIYQKTNAFLELKNFLSSRNPIRSRKKMSMNAWKARRAEFSVGLNPILLPNIGKKYIAVGRAVAKQIIMPMFVKYNGLNKSFTSNLDLDFCVLSFDCEFFNCILSM